MAQVRMVTGTMLIDAPASALNNAGLAEGIMAENRVVVKKVRVRGREEYPYVAGQALKRWWRESVYREFGWTPSPITREEKVAYTQANPISYEEDDIFGYMLAPRFKIEEIGMVGGLVYRRVAPFKCTPLISLFPNVVGRPDFGVFSRGREATAEPVPYEQEFYSTVLKGAFSLMLNEIGVFSRGRGMDLPKSGDGEEALKGKKVEGREKQLEGFKKRAQELEKEAQNLGANIQEDIIILPPEERKRRAIQTLSVLPKLAGGAKRSNYLTEVSPKLLVTAIISNANHIFMDLVKATGGKIQLDLDALSEVVKDYKEDFLSPIFIGLRKGFLDDDEYEKIAKLSGFEFDDKKVEVNFGTPREVITRLTQKIEELTL